MPWTKEEKRLLKLADKHMRMLEKAGGNALKFAYARVQKDIARLGGKAGKGGVYRLDRAKPENERKAKALLNAARSFLASESSTPAAIKRLEKKNLERFNKKFGVNLTLSQYAAVAEIYERSDFGSYTITEVIKAVERHDADFLRQLGMIQDLQVDVFGVPAGITSKSELLNEVLSAMGESVEEWKTSEILPI